MQSVFVYWFSFFKVIILKKGILPEISKRVYIVCSAAIAPAGAVENLISRSCGLSMARFASILGQKVAINQMLNLLHICDGDYWLWDYQRRSINVRLVFCEPTG